jgi:antitoxin ParD1/3/4
MALKVTIGAEFEALIERLIESDRYSIPAEIVDDALSYFEERERANEAKLELLRAEIQKGFDSGPPEEIDPKILVEDVKTRGRLKLAAEEREAKLEALRAAIQEGYDSGPAEEFDPKTLAEDVKRRGWERLAAEKLAAEENG